MIDKIIMIGETTEAIEIMIINEVIFKTKEITIEEILEVIEIMITKEVIFRVIDQILEVILEVIEITITKEEVSETIKMIIEEILDLIEEDLIDKIRKLITKNKVKIDFKTEEEEIIIIINKEISEVIVLGSQITSIIEEMVLEVMIIEDRTSSNSKIINKSSLGDSLITKDLISSNRRIIITNKITLGQINKTTLIRTKMIKLKIILIKTLGRKKTLIKKIKNPFLNRIILSINRPIIKPMKKVKTLIKTPIIISKNHNKITL